MTEQQGRTSLLWKRLRTNYPKKSVSSVLKNRIGIAQICSSNCQDVTFWNKTFRTVLLCNLFPLDKTKMFCFCDFTLILFMVSSCYQPYSVSSSEGKLIPNSALFIYHFVSFTPGFWKGIDLLRDLRKPVIPDVSYLYLSNAFFEDAFMATFYLLVLAIRVSFSPKLK